MFILQLKAQQGMLTPQYTFTCLLSLQGYSMEHTLKKWTSLNYLSHWVVLGTFVFYVMI